MAIAKDLGFSHYGYGDPHPHLDKNIADLQGAARRICCTGGWQQDTGHVITEQNVACMRKVVCTAMGDTEGWRPDAVRLSIGAGSQVEA